MEATGTNGRELLARLQNEEHCTLSEGHLSNILRGSRRCSLRVAIGLHEITGVGIKVIARWPPERKHRTSVAYAEVSEGNQA